MRILQFEGDDRTHRVGIVEDDGDRVRVYHKPARVYDLALEAVRARQTLEAVVLAGLDGETRLFHELRDGKRILPPLDHPDPSHCLVTGTGLSHLGSAQSRDEMHAKLAAGDEQLTDSMKMFKLGLEGGKPAFGSIGAQPEWFWKGDGSIVAGCGRPLVSPRFAEDAGEEAEIAGLYVIGDDRQPYRLGFALANEFADHVMEQRNYLYLAHSKLRACAVGPELRTGPLPEHVSGTVRIRRSNEVIFESEFLSGERNMSHTIANLEHHHFKYELFRRPGDVHIHFFGTGVLSFTAGIRAQSGDVFELESEQFGNALSNPLAVGPDDGLVSVKSL